MWCSAKLFLMRSTQTITKRTLRMFGICAILLVTGCGGSSGSGTSSTESVTLSSEFPSFAQILNIDTSLTGFGVTIANQDSGYYLPETRWPADGAGRITRFNALTGGTDITTNTVEALHGNTVSSAFLAERSNGTWGIAPGASALLVSDEFHPTTDTLGRGVIVSQANRWDVANFSFIGRGRPYTLTRHNQIRNAMSFRNGRGAIIFAGSGNTFRAGSPSYDPNNLTSSDGQDSGELTDSPYTMAVGMVTQQMVKASYSDAPPSLFTMGVEGQPLTFPSTGYSTALMGTSYASPQLAGIAAQMLEANPTLTWLDVREIIATSSRMVDSSLTAYYTTATDGVRIKIRNGWTTNVAGYAWSNWYGFGLIDASKATSLARTWSSGATLNRWTESDWFRSPEHISTVTVGVSTEVVYAVNVTDRITIDSIHVQIAGLLAGDQAGLQLTIVSPAGTEIIIKTPNNLDPYIYTRWGEPLHGGTFSYGDQAGVYQAVGYRGEASQGTWQLRIRKLLDTDFMGIGDPSLPFYSIGFQLRFFGLSS